MAEVPTVGQRSRSFGWRDTMFGGDRDDESSAQAEKMHTRIDALENKVQQLAEKVESFEEQEDDRKMEEYELHKAEYELEDAEDEMEAAVDRLEHSIMSVRRRQANLEEKVDEEYLPELQNEHNLLERLLKVMRMVQERLDAYGEMRKELRQMKQELNNAQADVAGKIGRSEFEDLKVRTEEDIKRLKSQLDMLE